MTYHGADTAKSITSHDLLLLCRASRAPRSVVPPIAPGQQARISGHRTKHPEIQSSTGENDDIRRRGQLNTSEAATGIARTTVYTNKFFVYTEKYTLK